MSTSLGYSIIESFNNNQENNNINKRRNRTIKNKKNEEMKSMDKVNNIREKMGLEGFSNSNDIEAMNEMDTDSLANFEPPENPKSAGSERMQLRESIDKTQEDKEDDTPVSRETFSDINGGYAQQYYDQFIPYYTNASNKASGGEGEFNKSEIMTKLNYLINLIEEEHDEKKNSVTEELVLYCFLGVFVIFIVDSFTKAGKYVR